MSDTFNQNHSGSGNNVINIGRQRFEMTPEIMQEVAENLDKSRSVDIIYRNTNRSASLAPTLHRFLEARGFSFSSVTGIGTLSGWIPEDVIQIHPNGLVLAPPTGGVVNEGRQIITIDVAAG